MTCVTSTVTVTVVRGNNSIECWSYGTPTLDPVQVVQPTNDLDKCTPHHANNPTGLTECQWGLVYASFCSSPLLGVAPREKMLSIPLSFVNCFP